MPAADQHLAADPVGFVVLVEFLAGVVEDVDLSVDDLPAAFAFDGEIVELPRRGGGGESLGKFLEEVSADYPKFIKELNIMIK